MMLAMATWSKIREQFTEQEKAALNVAIDGEILCPRGVSLDEEKLGPELTKKITDLKATTL